jgi:hypothetical protein
MASLFDLVQQYLKRDNLPKPFTYDRTPPIGTNPPMLPVQPGKPIEKLLPRPGGNEDGFSVYNPDPNRTRNESNYSPYNYRQAAERNLIGDFYSSGTEAQKLMDNYPDYYEGKQLEGIPGAIVAYAKNSLPGRIIGGVANFVEDKLPVNRRAIYENELLGQGIMLNDIGQIVSDGGNINTAENIMAGYNANKVTAQTFQKRRDMINAKMKDPVQKAAKLAALDAAEEKMLGTAKTRADMVFDDKSLAKDPKYKSQQELIELGIKSSEDDKEDDMFSPLNLETTTAPAFMNFYNPYEKNYTTDPYVSGQDDKDIGITPPGTSDDGYVTDYYGGDPVIDAGGTAPGGGYATDYYGGDPVIDAGGTAPGGGYTTDYYGGNSVIDAGGTAPGGGYTSDYYGGDQYSDDNFMAGDNSKADPTGTGNFSDQVTGNDTSPGATGGEGGGGTGGNSKIVCTMMNESYGFGSFRNKIWMKFHKDLSPEYQKGYHKLFLPLVRIAKTNKVVKKILEHIAVHSTIDMRQATRGKMHLLGRIYRKILLPLCYIVGKHG